MPEYAYVARTAPAVSAGRKLIFTAAEWLDLAGVYGFIAILHVAGWWLYLHYAAEFPRSSASDSSPTCSAFVTRSTPTTSRRSTTPSATCCKRDAGPSASASGSRSGHSTIVLCLAVGIAFAATAVKDGLPGAQECGRFARRHGVGTFLWIIGVLNLLVLLDILGVWKKAKAGTHDHKHLEELLAKRGFLNRLFGNRLQKMLNHSWQMYPLGLLFGLGFDTASEVGLLALTAGASAGNLPIPAILCLPILFAAGMTLMDTTDGVLMAKAYNWAFVNPLRKIFYNLTTTSLSIVVALLIGTIQLAQVSIRVLDLDGPAADFIARLEFGALGYVIVGLFLVGWGLSVALWKFRRIEQRYGGPVAAAQSPARALRTESSTRTVTCIRRTAGRAHSHAHRR
jgi:high-affinity nickel-transport protein